jgi:hypothetical protein
MKPAREIQPGVFRLDATVKGPPPDLSYEFRQRQHILSRDWRAVHISADRREPFATIIGRLWGR